MSSTIPGFGLSVEPVEVEATSLDDITRELAPRRTDFVKIDVEGAERDG